MGSRHGDVSKLVARVRKIGWPVTRNKRGYRVKTPDGMVIVIHTSYSDVNSLSCVTRRLQKEGL